MNPNRKFSSLDPTVSTQFLMRSFASFYFQRCVFVSFLHYSYLLFATPFLPRNFWYQYMDSPRSTAFSSEDAMNFSLLNTAIQFSPRPRHACVLQSVLWSKAVTMIWHYLSDLFKAAVSIGYTDSSSHRLNGIYLKVNHLNRWNSTTFHFVF